jgi:cytochrome P450
VHRQEGASQVDNGVLGRLLKEESLPDDAVPDFIINLLFAGNETTSKTMLFAVYFLTHCPKAMKQLLVRVCVYIYIYILMENFTYYSLCFINYFCN